MVLALRNVYAHPVLPWLLLMWCCGGDMVMRFGMRDPRPVAQVVSSSGPASTICTHRARALPHGAGRRSHCGAFGLEVEVEVKVQVQVEVYVEV